jgi:hypothetical protein
MSAKPPETAERLLLFLLPEQVRDYVSGDLSEIFSAIIVPGCGIFRARLWYWRQVVCSMRLFFRFRNNPQNALEFWKGRIQVNRPMNGTAKYHSGISMHHIPVQGGVGLLFAFATVFIFGVGIRAVREIFMVTGSMGILGSGILLYWHMRHPHKIQTLDLHKQK